MRVNKNDAADPAFADIFFLAPAGRRVTFYSQQARALNLVWALRKANVEIGSTAVVGAGVAGVTASCALAACGSKVDLFEEAMTPMWRQSSTRHRVVHPHINQWPTIDRPETGLMPLTDLPFLNWHFSTCDAAIAMMRRDMEHFEDRILFEPSTTVVGFNQRDGKITVHTSKEKRGPYDVVVVCTGFTPEAGVKVGPPSREYWCSDDLERKRAHGKTKHYVINGAGDGGLIDTLRLVYQSFDYGRLTIKVAELMTATAPDLVEQIAQAEHALQLSQKSASADTYQRVAARASDKTLYPDLSAFLDRALGNQELDVFLVDDKLPSAWASLKAAPVHKFLVAFAHNAQRLTFERAPISFPKKNWRKGEVSVNTRNLSVDDTEFVFRFGAKPTFGKLLSKANAESVMDRQSIANNFYQTLVDPTMAGVFTRLPPEHQPGAAEFMFHRCDLLERAWRGVDRNAAAFLDQGRLHLSTSVAERVPERIWGIDIAVNNASAAIHLDPIAGE
jgi:hypothetical protein